MPGCSPAPGSLLGVLAGELGCSEAEGQPPGHAAWMELSADGGAAHPPQPPGMGLGVGRPWLGDHAWPSATSPRVRRPSVGNDPFQPRGPALPLGTITPQLLQPVHFPHPKRSFWRSRFLWPCPHPSLTRPARHLLSGEPLPQDQAVSADGSGGITSSLRSPMPEPSVATVFAHTLSPALLPLVCPTSTFYPWPVRVANCRTAGR